jgi:hypothetical protein
MHVGRVFQISPFDWPALDNALASASKQALRWHGDASYTFMISERKDPGLLGACAK